MNKQVTNILNKESFAIFLRAFTAIIGGYMLSNLLATLLSYLLPNQAGAGAVTGMLVSYLIYAVIVIWVYSVKSLRDIWRHLFIISAACIIIIYQLIPEKIL